MVTMLGFSIFVLPWLLIITAIQRTPERRIKAANELKRRLG